RRARTEASGRGRSEASGRADAVRGAGDVDGGRPEVGGRTGRGDLSARDDRHGCRGPGPGSARNPHGDERALARWAPVGRGPGQCAPEAERQSPRRPQTDRHPGPEDERDLLADQTPEREVTPPVQRGAKPGRLEGGRAFLRLAEAAEATEALSSLSRLRVTF